MEVNFPYVNVTKQHQGKMTSDLHFDYNILPNIRAPFIHRLQRERKFRTTPPRRGFAGRKNRCPQSSNLSLDEADDFGPLLFLPPNPPLRGPMSRRTPPCRGYAR